MSVQPSAHLAGAERRGQGVGRRIAAAQPAQVDRRPTAGGRRARPGSRRAASATAGRSAGRGQDRRVVGVVRGAEEDRGRRRCATGVSSTVGAVAHLRVDRARRRARPRGDASAGRSRSGPPPAAASAGHDDQRLLVGVRAVGVPPRTLERPAGEGRRPRVAGRRGHPRSRAGCRRSTRRSTRSGARSAGRPWRSRSAAGQAGSRSRVRDVTSRMLHRSSVSGCGGNLGGASRQRAAPPRRPVSRLRIRTGVAGGSTRAGTVVGDERAWSGSGRDRVARQLQVWLAMTDTQPSTRVAPASRRRTRCPRARRAGRGPRGCRSRRRRSAASIRACRRRSRPRP